MLLENGVNIEAQDQFGRTELIGEAERGYEKVAERAFARAALLRH